MNVRNCKGDCVKCFKSQDKHVIEHNKEPAFKVMEVLDYLDHRRKKRGYVEHER